MPSQQEEGDGEARQTQGVLRRQNKFLPGIKMIKKTIRKVTPDPTVSDCFNGDVIH